MISNPQKLLDTYEFSNRILTVFDIYTNYQHMVHWYFNIYCYLYKDLFCEETIFSLALHLCSLELSLFWLEVWSWLSLPIKKLAAEVLLSQSVVYLISSSKGCIFPRKFSNYAQFIIDVLEREIEPRCWFFPAESSDCINSASYERWKMLAGVTLKSDPVEKWLPGSIFNWLSVDSQR